MLRNVNTPQENTGHLYKEEAEQRFCSFQQETEQLVKDHGAPGALEHIQRVNGQLLDLTITRPFSGSRLSPGTYEEIARILAAKGNQTLARTCLQEALVLLQREQDALREEVFASMGERLGYTEECRREAGARGLSSLYRTHLSVALANKVKNLEQQLNEVGTESHTANDALNHLNAQSSQLG